MSFKLNYAFDVRPKCDTIKVNAIHYNVVQSLLSDVSTSWTPEGVAVRVVTNKQDYCGNRLGITATMSNSSGFFNASAMDYVDGTVIINDIGLSPGMYTCTIAVVDQSGQVESYRTSCQVEERNGKQLYSLGNAIILS